MDLIKIFRKILHGGFNLLRQWFPTDSAIREEQLSGDFQLRSNFYASFVRAGDLCFDIGANVGNRVGPLLYVGARVVAVEPQPYCYTLLRKKYGRKIKLVTKGLGEKESVQDFYISSAHTISSFSKEFVDNMGKGRFKNYTWEPPIKIKITTLDKIIKKYGLPVFIKIDVEGYELEVLKGLSSPIRMISFEYTVPEQTNKVIECIQQIEKNREI